MRIDWSRHSVRNYSAAALNLLFASKPEVVFTGTGRCGTTHVSELLTRAGYHCSHEKYFTPEGPLHRNFRRSHRARADASWLAVPFLPDPEIRAIHVVRNPLDVIRSFFNIGFFDAEFAHLRPRFVGFARTHFDFSGDPMRDCLRWYVDWNTRCEAITYRRLAIERIEESRDQLSAWLDFEVPPVAISKDTNTRPKLVEKPVDDVRCRISEYPEFASLEAMAHRYGYEL